MVHLDEAVRIDLTKLKQHQRAKAGDIIFRSRGHHNTAALLQEDANNTIVAAPLFRVRPNAPKVIPEFLLWWINQPSSQSYLNSQAKGSLVKMISKQCLENLDVHLPSLERQREIAAFFSLSMREQHLLEAIRKCRMRYTQGILMHMASESRLTASNRNSGIDASASTPG